MVKDNTRKDSDAACEPRRFSFSFSTPGLISLAVVAVAALAWAFVLGVLVGRGYKPEQAMPELANIMPRAQMNATAPETERPAVLRAEDLGYSDDLNKKPGETTAVKPSVAKAPAAPKAATETPKAVTTPTTPAPSEATPAPTQQAAEQGGQRFNYVYQVASLRDPETAGRFAAKLRKLGLVTSIESAKVKDSTWHRVMVHFQGTPDETDALKDTLATQGIKKPIMKSKTPL